MASKLELEWNLADEKSAGTTLGLIVKLEIPENCFNLTSKFWDLSSKWYLKHVFWPKSPTLKSS
jgi:hypothetical protein